MHKYGSLEKYLLPMPALREFSQGEPV